MCRSHAPIMIMGMTTTRFALIAAPLAMTGYGITRYIGKLDDSYGPGLDWQVAHFIGLAGRAPWWSPVALLVGVLLAPVNLDLMPLTGLLMLVALLPIRRQLRRAQAGDLHRG